MKVVVDTNIMVSALLSGGGAPRDVLRLCLEEKIAPIFGTTLFAEYEDVLAREDLFVRSPLSASERNTLFDAIVSVGDWISVYYLWRSNLRNEDDNHLVELAIAGGAEWIITANLKDFREAELRFDHVRVGTAGMFLEERELRS